MMNDLNHHYVSPTVETTFWTWKRRSGLYHPCVEMSKLSENMSNNLVMFTPKNIFMIILHYFLNIAEIENTGENCDNIKQKWQNQENKL